MKENVLDVLMYLFETYVDTEEEPEADQNELRDELARAGFGDPEIDRALDWLDGLTDHQENLDYHSQTAHGTRIYSDFEQERLDAACRGYITYLEQIGILSPLQRGNSDRSSISARVCGYRCRTDQVGRADGVVLPTGSGTRLRAHGRSCFRREYRVSSLVGERRSQQR